VPCLEHKSSLKRLASLRFPSPPPPKGLRAFIIQDFDFRNAAIAAILAEGQEKGEIPTTHNPKELASYVSNSYHGAMLRGK